MEYSLIQLSCLIYKDGTRLQWTCSYQSCPLVQYCCIQIWSCSEFIQLHWYTVLYIAVIITVATSTVPHSVQPILCTVVTHMLIHMHMPDKQRKCIVQCICHKYIDMPRVAVYGINSFTTYSIHPALKLQSLVSNLVSLNVSGYLIVKHDEN